MKTESQVSEPTKVNKTFVFLTKFR